MPAGKPQTAEAYQKHREAMAQRMRDMRAAGSDIGELPPVANKRRKDKARKSLKFFCENYRPNAFKLDWSKDHLRVIDRMELTVQDGGLFAVAMPRGNGKTTLAITAAIWALLYGFRHWVCLVGATDKKAEKLLASIKSELRFNPRLIEDFPEVCWPIVALQGRAARAGTQTYQGQPTQMQWLSDFMVLPTVKGSKASGGIVSVCGITGDIRGQQLTSMDGEVLRPDYVIPDDPQTRESAKSAMQSDERLAIINGDILGLSGPGVKIAGVMPCTVIQRGDLADKTLDREVSPDWHGERTQMLYGFPTNMELWNQYREIQEASFRNGGSGEDATQFYIENRTAMDEGCEAAWAERYNHDEVSAIQNAMNLYYRDEATFWAEYQNHPLELKSDDATLTEDQITQRVNELAKGTLAEDTAKLVGFIDVQQDLLFYGVTAWRPDFTGFVVEYQAWPQQRGTNFTLATARQTFAKLWPGESFEARITKALKACVDHLMAKEYKTETGLQVPFSRILIDANWGQSRNLVYEFCRSSPYRSVLMPSHGKGITASNDPLNAKHIRKLGRAVGHHWRIDRAKDVPIRHVLYDTNIWKSFLHARLATDPGTAGSLTLFKAQPHEHSRLAKHLKSEYSVRTSGKGREVDEWKLKPDRPDNHWLDCLVGCCVAGAIEGIKLGASSGKKVKRSRAQASLVDGSDPGPNPGAPEPEAEAPEEPRTRKGRGKVSYL